MVKKMDSAQKRMEKELKHMTDVYARVLLVKQRQERKELLTQLVLKHNSYSKVASMVNLTRERVCQIVGRGLIKKLSKGSCLDCLRPFGEEVKYGSNGLCNRCAGRVRQTGRHWTTEEWAQRKNTRIKTHCINGHEYTPDNLYWMRGQRYCKICTVARNKAWRDKRTPEQVAAAKEHESEYHKGYYQRKLEDPSWAEAKRIHKKARYHTDPEYRARVLAANKKYLNSKTGHFKDEKSS